MKTLTDVLESSMTPLYESIFDTFDDEGNVTTDSSELIKQEIIDWISNHYMHVRKAHNYAYKEKIKPAGIKIYTQGEKYIVDYKYSIFCTNPSDDGYLTNGQFVWGKIGGDFIIRILSGKQLISLKGCPEEIKGDFECEDETLSQFDTFPKNIGKYIYIKCENLTSLKGLPKYANNVQLNFCQSLTSLEGAPEIVEEMFYCYECKNLTSLKGGPKKVRDFYCKHCDSLKSLVGAPEKVDEDFNCYGCKSLESLKGAPEKVGENFNCSDCPNLISLKGAPREVGGDFYCDYCYSLESLEGAPKEVGGDFYCDHCISLKSFEGAPKYVGGKFRHTL